MKWLNEVFKSMKEGGLNLASRKNANAIYEIIAAPAFCGEGNWHHSQTGKAFDLITANRYHFSEKQNKYLNSDRFPFYKKHAVIEILTSDDEAE